MIITSTVFYILIGANLLLITNFTDSYYDIGLPLSYILFILLNVLFQRCLDILDKDITNKMLGFKYTSKEMSKTIQYDYRLVDSCLLVFISNMFVFSSVYELNRIKPINEYVYFSAFGNIKYTFIFLIVASLIFLIIYIVYLYNIYYAYKIMKSTEDKINEKR